MPTTPPGRGTPPGRTTSAAAPFAATAVTYSANPGTGLERSTKAIPSGCKQQADFKTGALFNVVARTVDTGQRVVFALNTGIDPSWAVGSNDDGNTTSTAGANAQHSIGASLRFDGKTSGSKAETTISQSRMALGGFSIPEAQKAKSTAPIRRLDIGFDYTSATIHPDDEPTQQLRSGESAKRSPNSFSDDRQHDTKAAMPHATYGATLISHYNTVKAPNVTALNSELVEPVWGGE